MIYYVVHKVTHQNIWLLYRTFIYTIKSNIKIIYKENVQLFKCRNKKDLAFSCARSRESKGCPNSGFDRGVGLSGRYPLKPSISASLLETKRYPEHTAVRSSRESHKCKYFRLKQLILKYWLSCFVFYTVLYICICNHVLNWKVLANVTLLICTTVPHFSD